MQCAMTFAAPFWDRSRAIMPSHENPQSARQTSLAALGPVNRVDEFTQRKLALVGYLAQEVPELRL